MGSALHGSMDHEEPAGERQSLARHEAARLMGELPVGDPDLCFMIIHELGHLANWAYLDMTLTPSAGVARLDGAASAKSR